MCAQSPPDRRDLTFPHNADGKQPATKQSAAAAAAAAAEAALQHLDSAPGACEPHRARKASADLLQAALLYAAAHARLELAHAGLLFCAHDAAEEIAALANKRDAALKSADALARKGQGLLPARANDAAATHDLGALAEPGATIYSTPPRACTAHTLGK